MRRPAWNGSPPSGPEEARERITTAAMRCIDTHGARGTSLSRVAAELGVIRQTVYRYYPSTEALFAAVGYAARDSFVDRLVAHLAGRADPAELAVEAVAFTVEELPAERYLTALMNSGEGTAFSRYALSEVALGVCREAFARTDVEWAAHGFTGQELDELIEFLVRVLLSFVEEAAGASAPPRRGAELRAYLRRWVAPAVRAAAHAGCRETRKAG
ncbi:TetR/AcrR family transcriptional regulator [Nocardia sp. NPDC057227]|uniref:TetR/AcrR family transcriptional regulator n=1 Tax=Nocardia sp. NPDC057227 TaxID=3346056 RepID=UPI00362D9807